MQYCFIFSFLYYYGAGICGYCVGALNIPHHPLPWETSARNSTSISTNIAISAVDTFTSVKGADVDAGPAAEDNSSSWVYPTNLASPLNILIEASNGASDYGKILCMLLLFNYCMMF